MNLKSIIFVLGTGLLALVVAGCSNDDSAENTGSALDGQNGQGIDSHNSSDGLELDENGESGIGFELDDQGNVSEAKDVPAEAEEAILDTFNSYIETFNEKDIEGYLATLSEKTGNFDLDEEREQLDQVFESFDVVREVELQTINKFEGEEAQVYSDLILTTTDPATGAEVTKTGRQITVLNLVDGEWKIVSIHFMVNPS
ncbi:YybH family protein [Jeotgalibacillus marinus]|uniref:Nuclear transport factor 2 family protein n=1 Tax=Jeotgalibacillus marinus TaxID=86667 RepID=A0ABV3Q4J4_9BACL